MPGKPWPHRTAEQMIAAGYTYHGEGYCRGMECNREIQWWRTPNGSLLCIDKEHCEPHWAWCRNIADFRRRHKEGGIK